MAPYAPQLSGSIGEAETAMASAADPLGDSRRTTEVNLFAAHPADGAHELIVNCAGHHANLGELSAEQVIAAVGAWRERMRAQAEHASYLHLSVTEGAGTCGHSHAELHALRFVPATVARERERATAYHQRTMGSHLLGDVVSQEVRKRERLVAIDDDVVLVAPWASARPYELRVVPRRPAPSFEADGQGGAEMLTRALAALGAVLGPPVPVTLWIRTAPRGAGEFCWHLDLAPNTVAPVGLEAGTGVPVNPVAPEVAAAALREAI